MAAPSSNASNDHPVQIVGGISLFRDVTDEDMKIWDMYKKHLEKKLRDQFHVAESHSLKPSKVATQVVAGQNYFFKVGLPEKKFATARVYHVPWQANTHGQDQQVAVHHQATDDVNASVGHF